MQFARILTSSLPMLMGLAAGLTVPQGLPDGNYLGFVTPDGDEIHENLDTGINITIPLVERRAVGDAAPGSPSTLTRRQKPKGGDGGSIDPPVVYCGCLSRMNPIDCEDAVNGLKWQLDRNTNQDLMPQTCWYAIRNSVVAFTCNHTTVFRAYVNNRQYTGRLERITRDCGYYVPGTFETGDFGATLSGYINYHDGLDFFRTATSSKKHKC